MVSRIVSTHIRRKSEQFVASVVTLTFALISLSACGAQEDASAQNNKIAQSESNKSAKPEIGSASAGQIIFEKANCAMCHPGGNNTMDPGHPIKGPEFASKYSDDTLLENTIRKGFPNVGMPSFSKKVIDEREMKDLIAYVRSLTPAVKVAPPKAK